MTTRVRGSLAIARARTRAAGRQRHGEPDFRAGPSHGEDIEQGRAYGGQLAKRRRLLEGTSGCRTIPCVLLPHASLLVYLSRLSANMLLVAVEKSAAGMATAIQEVRTLTAGGAESKQLRQLAEMESKYQMREAETQLKPKNLRRWPRNLCACLITASSCTGSFEVCPGTC